MIGNQIKFDNLLNKMKITVLVTIFVTKTLMIPFITCSVFFLLKCQIILR